MRIQRWTQCLQLPNRNLLFAVLLVVGLTSPALAAQGTRAGTFLGEKTLSGQAGSLQSPQQSISMPLLPTIPYDQYLNLKAAAAASASAARPGAPLGSTSTPTVLNFNFPGLNQNEAADLGFIFRPPDVNSAVGELGQIVEVVNNHYACFDKGGTRLQDIPMSVFFGYSQQFLTDPRVVYDHISNRWIVTEVGFPESAERQLFFLAVSTTSDCTGSFFVYNFNMVRGPDDLNNFFDYPQVGFDQGALIFTFNVFNGTVFRYAEVDMAAKAQVYNGLDVVMPFVNQLPGTLTPNLVRDNNDTTVLINNVPFTPTVRLFRLFNTNTLDPSITGPFDVDTGFVCEIPRNAMQPGTDATLDTLDTRFQAPGTQIGDSLFQVQTCGPGLPTPRVLQIDIKANTLIRQDFVFWTPPSDDFNPSVAANDFGDAVVSWSSTDEQAGNNASVVFSGKLAGDDFGPVGVCFTSPTAYEDHRWGDTSGASVDPTDPTQRTFLTSNETILDAHHWGTEICNVTITP